MPRPVVVHAGEFVPPNGNVSTASLPRLTAAKFPLYALGLCVGALGAAVLFGAIGAESIVRYWESRRQ